MSRSIHDTRRFLFEALYDNFADRELQGELVRTARHNLRQQRSIKDHTRQQRRRGELQLPPLDPEHVPIVSVDQSPWVHHALTEEDLRAVMRRLPPGSLDGLNAVELCLGGKARGGGNPSAPRDPYTDSPGREILPGIYTGLDTGDYDKDRRTIRIFAYVHEVDAPGVLGIVLKLTALLAFTQQAAHHFDHTFRAGGSRWRGDDRDKNESYAARVALAHAIDHVVPYLQERYAAECAALSAWMQEHGGVALPLLALIGDRKERQERVLRALRTLASAARNGERAETRSGFAQALHDAGYHDFALAAIARILTEQPAHPGALCVRACVAACRGEYELAEHTCRGVLAGAPACAAAWEVLSRVCFAQRRWQDLVACSTAGFELREGGAETRYRQLAYRAQAQLALGRWEPLAEDLAALRAWGNKQGARAADVFTALMLCRREKWAEAHLEACRLLERPGFAGAAAELEAVRFESAHRMGRPRRAGTLTEQKIERLRAAGYEAWADRLVAEYGPVLLRSPARGG